MIPNFMTAVAAIGEKVLSIVPPKTTPILITGQQLDLCTQTLTPKRCADLADLINEMCAIYGVKTRDALHEPLANFIQESGEFNHRQENMNYRDVTIVKTWPGRFYLGTPKPGKLNAADYARKPIALANAVYGAKNNVLGNRPGTSDGYDNRGSGYVGLTGGFVLGAFAKYKGLPDAKAAAEYARGSDRGAMDSAFWFAYVLKDLMDEAERDEMIGIVREINGGTIGLAVRLAYYELCKKYVV